MFRVSGRLTEFLHSLGRYLPNATGRYRPGVASSIGLELATFTC